MSYWSVNQSGDKRFPVHVEMYNGTMCFDLHLNQAAELSRLLDTYSFGGIDSRQGRYFVAWSSGIQSFIFRPAGGPSGPPVPEIFAIMLAGRIKWVMDEIQENAALELEAQSGDSLAGAGRRMYDNLRGVFR